MDMNELLEPFSRMLEGCAAPAAVRAVEAGGSAGAMWNEIEASGFLDALVPEAHGGAGLSLREAGCIWQALGRHAVPLPVAETMIARALLAEAGCDVPSGAVALATGGAGDEVTVAAGRTAAYVLVDLGDRLVLVEAAGMAATGVRGDVTGRMKVSLSSAAPAIRRPAHGVRPLSALVRAAQMAGAAARLLDMTVAYANERQQFGKPIGRQQALQQQLAVMAEDAVAMRLAVELACEGEVAALSLAQAATAKSIASTAAPRIANTAHAVHGAIGISEEYDLQILTRALHTWRLSDGSEGYWNRVLGDLRIASPSGSVDWVREALFA